MSNFKPNSFQVPNIIIDEYMGQLSNGAFKCYMLIVRKTMGWHKRSDGLAQSQFKLATGIKSNNTIRKSLDELIGHKLIVEQPLEGRYSTFKINTKFTGIEAFTPSNIDGATPSEVEGEPPQILNTTPSEVEGEPPQYLSTQTNTNQTNTNKSNKGLSLVAKSSKKVNSYPVWLSADLDDSEEAANELQKRQTVFDYRKSIKKPLKTISGVIGLIESVRDTAIAWGVTEKDVWIYLTRKEWQSIEPGYQNPFAGQSVVQGGGTGGQL